MKSIINNEKRCYVCGCYGSIEEHHIFFGRANRKKSEQYGLKVYLCVEHHRASPGGVHGGNKELNYALKRIGQQHFEKTHTREEFMQEFGKNYLD